MVERRLHFRGKARAGRRVELQYRILDPDTEELSSPISAVTSNIGLGGAFILTDEPQAVNTRLHMFLTIPTAEEPMLLRADVRWVVEPDEDRHGAGMGVRFYGLEVDDLLMLSEYFASLTLES